MEKVNLYFTTQKTNLIGIGPKNKLMSLLSKNTIRERIWMRFTEIGLKKSTKSESEIKET